MSTVAKRSQADKTKPWWRYRRNRMRLWAVLAIAGIAAVAAVLWISNQRSSDMMTAGSVPIGKQVKAATLEDSRDGQMFDLGQYLGKKDIVIVAYMGEFCLGCSELVGELQRRAPEFEAANAQLVVLGSEVGQTGRDTAAKHDVTAYPLLQEGEPNMFTRSIGMWSDMMGMPWMGYVIIDKSGKIVSGEQMGLSEARGAAPQNVDKLLRSLSAAKSSKAGG